MKHGGDIYSDGILKGKELIDFSSNINPLGVPKSVIDNLSEGINMLKVYPDVQYRTLRDNLIEYLNNSYSYFDNSKKQLNLERKNLLLGNGASEILDLAINFLKSITIVVPSFIEYEDNGKKHNLHIEYSKLKEDFTYDYENILNKVKKTEGLIIGNPNNPNGCIIDKKKIQPILEYCEKNNKIIIIDEAFIEFTKSIENSFVDLVENYKSLIIVRAITKFYGLPGVRFGFGITSNEKVIEFFNKMQNPWNINCFAEIAVKYALKDKEYIKNSLQWIEEERNYMIEALKEISIIKKVYKTYGNYILCQLEKINCEELYKILKEKEIIIRKCDNYKGLDNKFIRVAIKNRQLNEKLINELKFISLEGE